MNTYTVSWMIEVEAYTPEGAAELAQRIQRDQNSTANIFHIDHVSDNYEIDLDSGEYLRGKLQDLSDNILSLECGDDMLFSNKNGNLERYKALCAEKKLIMEKLS